MTYPGSVTIYEVGPRDGLQNEDRVISVDTKVEFINRLSKTGLRKIEAGAFVSPRWVPQMADTLEVFSRIENHEGVVFPALVPNEKGLEAAIKAGIKEIAVFGAASETFSRKNINASLSESFDRFEPVIKDALSSGIQVRGYVSCVVDCPYEGRIEPENVAEIAEKLYNLGCYQISLGDTIGTGTPQQIGLMLASVKTKIPVKDLALHCHDTYGMAVANIVEGLKHGVSTFDSSVGGLGGCPYAPGAAGNVATEDVIYLLNGLGVNTDINLHDIIDCAIYISGELDRDLKSRTGQAFLNKKEGGC